MGLPRELADRALRRASGLHRHSIAHAMDEINRDHVLRIVSPEAEVQADIQRSSHSYIFFLTHLAGTIRWIVPEECARLSMYEPIQSLRPDWLTVSLRSWQPLSPQWLAPSSAFRV